MRAITALWPVFCLGIPLCGCALHRPALVLERVGPAPAASAATRTNGFLVVYSAFDSGAHLSGLPYSNYYSDYRLFSEAGGLIERVHNENESAIQGPKKLTLQPGNYRIVARANAYGEVSVPVQVLAGKVTEVHLEGESPPLSAPAEAVTLPGGQFVGFRAGEGPPTVRTAPGPR